MKNNTTIIISSFFGSIIFTIVIIVLLPFKFNKYILEFDQKQKKLSELVYSYSNLDSVPDTELFIQGVRNKISYVSFRQYDSSAIHKGVIHEINWTVPFITNSHPFFHDYDHDSINEAFVFFIKDSIVVAGVIDLHENMTGGPFIFIDTIKPFRGKYNPVIRKVVAKDMNEDGVDELIFTLTNTNGVFPRTIYITDFVNKSVNKGPKTASVLSISDTITIDNNTLFLMSSGAAGNCSDTTFIYHDYNSYLMAMDSDLEFLFEPIVNKGFTSTVNAVFIPESDPPLIAALFSGPTTSDSSNLLQLYNLNGNLIKQREVDIKFRRLISDRNSKEDRLLLFSKYECRQLDNDLNEVETFNHLGPNLIPMDVDGDGANEFLSLDLNNELFTIYRSDFTHPVNIEFNFPIYIPFISLKSDGKNQPLLAINTNDYLVVYRYGKNRLYFFKYLIYTVIFILNFVIIFAILLYNKAKIEQRHSDENKLLNYQLLALKNQIDPHFALNTLNAISYLYNKNDVAQANNLFEKYSKLTRQTLISSNRISETLKNELNYIRNYLDLEIYRYESRFEYQIVIDDGVDTNQLLIPRMLIHTFVENAVKHGIKHLTERKGVININISYGSSQLNIRIKDNGIGMKESQKYSKYSTGKGMEIAEEMVRLYNRLHQAKLSVNITDPNIGTQVLITMRNPKDNNNNYA